MNDVKVKMKGLMKKLNNSFSSSNSGEFKRKGRVLGSSSSPDQALSLSLSNSKALPQKTNNISEPSPRKVSNSPEQKLENKKPEILANKNEDKKDGNGFDPFNSLITSGNRNPHGYSLRRFLLMLNLV